MTSKEIWSSSVDEEMVADAGLEQDEIENLIRELDDAVMEICLSFGVC